MLSRGVILEFLDVEGPVVVERVFQNINKASGLKKVGQKIRRKLLDSLQPLVAAGDVLLEDPLNTGEILESTIRLPHQPAVRVRSNGGRLDKWHIPPGEIAAVLKFSPVFEILIAKFASAKRSSYTGRRN